MLDNPPSLFCDSALAARIERAEADLISAHARAAHRRRRDGGADVVDVGDGAGFLTLIAGGVASFADHDSPYNKVAGLGFAGVPALEELEAIERAFAAHGSPTQVELAHLAEPEIGVLLTQRGYWLESYENVLGRAIDAAQGPSSMPPGIEVRPSGDDEFEDWLRVIAGAAAAPDLAGLPWHDDFPTAIYEQAQRDSRAAGTLRFAALREGHLAGGAQLNLTDGIAQFIGAGTAPHHRRHGIQAGLLTARLQVAAEAGCDLAIVVTQPGSTSQANVQRQGFDLLYTRAVLVKRP